MRMQQVSGIGAAVVIASCLQLAAGRSRAASATFEVEGSVTLARIAGQATRFRVPLALRMTLDDDGAYQLSPIQGACVPSRQIGGRVDIRGGRVVDEILARGVRAVTTSCFGRGRGASLPDIHVTEEGDTIVGTFSARSRLRGVVGPGRAPAFALWRGRFVGWRID
jgi:hypothetical protein